MALLVLVLADKNSKNTLIPSAAEDIGTSEQYYSKYYCKQDGSHKRREYLYTI